MREIPLTDPECDECGDTGYVVVWVMGWHGFDECEIPCRKCTRGEA